jgi:hypothetical protein
MPHTLEREASLRILVSILIPIGIVTCAGNLPLGGGACNLVG